MQLAINLYVFFFEDVDSSSPMPTLCVECNNMLAWLVANVSMLGKAGSPYDVDNSALWVVP
jgi:hypothetical protein